MPEAPEGSEDRAIARAMLLRSVIAALERGQSATEWLAWVQQHMPATVGTAGERDVEAIVKFALGRRRSKRW